MERRLEKEKRELNDALQREIEEIEKQEKHKFEKKLAQMKKELALASAAPDMENEISEFSQQQELEFER